jgi:hypothetical protein
MTNGLTPAVLSTGNILLCPGPAYLNATIATDPDGAQAIIVTIRTTSGEQTVWLTRDEAQTWVDALAAKIAKMSSLVIPPRGSPGLPGMNGGRP